MELGVKNKNVNIEIYADKGIQIQGGSTVKILEGTKVSAHMNGTAKADRVGVGDEEIYTQFEMRGQDSTSSIQNENDPKGSTPKPFTLKFIMMSNQIQKKNLLLALPLKIILFLMVF